MPSVTHLITATVLHVLVLGFYVSTGDEPGRGEEPPQEEKVIVSIPEPVPEEPEERTPEPVETANAMAEQPEAEPEALDAEPTEVAALDFQGAPPEAVSAEEEVEPVQDSSEALWADDQRLPAITTSATETPDDFVQLADKLDTEGITGPQLQFVGLDRDTVNQLLRSGHASLVVTTQQGALEVTGDLDHPGRPQQITEAQSRGISQRAIRLHGEMTTKVRHWLRGTWGFQGMEAADLALHMSSALDRYVFQQQKRAVAAEGIFSGQAVTVCRLIYRGGRIAVRVVDVRKAG